MTRRAEADQLNAWPEPPPHRKRSDQIAAEIKQWIVNQKKVPGDKLPQEKDLMQLFNASKGVTREALKSLEVQGLITITTGPGGGATLCDVPESCAVGHLANYFYFKPFPAAQLYEISKVLEPALAASVVGCLADDQFEELEQTIEICLRTAHTLEAVRQQRMAEVRFHEILAEACPNVFMSFMGKFLNKLFYDFISFKRLPEFMPSQERFRLLNLKAHQKIVQALKDQDREAVFDFMKQHLDELDRFIQDLEVAVEKKFLYL